MNISAKILIVDDHPAVREGLSLLLEQDRHTLCGEASSRAELVALLSSVGPDIALVDLSLDEESGLVCIPDLLSSGIPVIVYSMHEDLKTVKRALDCGARGFVSKREASVSLLDAIQAVLGGTSYLSPRVAANLESIEGMIDTPTPSPQFSGREIQALTLLGQGATYADIASELDVSIRTVETYFNRMRIKLELDGMKALRKYALRECRPV